MTKLAAADLPDLEFMDVPRLEIPEGTSPEEQKSLQETFQDAEKEFQYWKRLSPVSWERMRQAEIRNAYLPGASSFYETVIPAMLTAQEAANPVCAPLSAYHSSLILQEATANKMLLSSRIYGLASRDEKQFQEGINGLWQSNFVNAERTCLALHTSLWLGRDTDVDQETLDVLSQMCHVDVLRTEGDAEIDPEVQEWLKESGITMENAEVGGVPDGTLISTVDLSARFRKKTGTETDSVFHGTGGDQSCFFEEWESPYAECFNRERFAAAWVELELVTSSGKMWFILPEEGVSPEDLLSDPELYDVFISKDSDLRTLTLSMPGFHSEAVLDATDALKPQVFEGDWGGLTTSCLQALSLDVSPYGCNAADEGDLMWNTLAAGGEEQSIVLDRPFLYAVTSEEGDIILMGIVNQV